MSTYTVKAGDTLTDIADQFGVTVDALIAANPDAANLLSTGDILTLPELQGVTGGNVLPDISVTAKKLPTMQTPLVLLLAVMAIGLLLMLASDEGED
jgi:LysM repeat protein